MTEPFVFDPKSYIQEPKLKLCGMAARAVWPCMLCYMHVAKPRGYFKLTPEAFCERAGFTKRQFDTAVADLVKHEVCSKAEDGALFSRRMVRSTKEAAEEKLNQVYEALIDQHPNSTEHGFAKLTWERFIQEGVITPENAHEVLEGLDRWKQSRVWVSGFIKSVGKWLAEKAWVEHPQKHPRYRDIEAIRNPPKTSTGGHNPMAVLRLPDDRK